MRQSIEEFLIGKIYKDDEPIPYNKIISYIGDDLFKIYYLENKESKAYATSYESLVDIIYYIKHFHFIKYNKKLINELIKLYLEYMI